MPKIPKHVRSKPAKFDIRQNLSLGVYNLTTNNQPMKATTISMHKWKYGEINKFSIVSILLF